MRRQAEPVSGNTAAKQDVGRLKKKPIIKSGAMMIGGFIAVIGVVPPVLPLILK